MAIEIRPLGEAIGAEVRGIAPTGALDGNDFQRVRQAWLDHCLLLFRGMTMSPEQQIAFTRRFGALHVMTPLEYNLPEHPEVFVVSNVVRDGREVGLKRAGWGWHSDGEDKQVPNAGSMLYAISVPPEGGDTCFANMYRAYEALPEDVRTLIEGRRGRFSRAEMHHVHYPLMPPLTEQQRRERPDVWHPLVRQHPESGRRSLYIGRWCVEIEGLDDAEGKRLIQWLSDFAVRPERVYRHRWRVGDAVLWDNRCTQHCAQPFDDARHERYMLRTTLDGDVPCCGDIRSTTVAAA